LPRYYGTWMKLSHVDELVVFFCCCIWDNGKKIPWRRLKLCGCTIISYEFSISYGIWIFLYSFSLSLLCISESHDSLRQNVCFCLPTTYYIWVYKLWYMYGIPLLSNSPFLKNFWSWWFWHFNSFCWFFGCNFHSLILSIFKICDFRFGNYFQIQKPSSLVCLRTGFNSYVHIPRFEMLYVQSFTS
jgi:hypothetical protein